MTAVLVDGLRAEHVHGDALGIGTNSPRLSWRTKTVRPAWVQAGYEVEIDGTSHGRVDSEESVLVAWPGEPLASRERRRVRVRVWGVDGTESPWSDDLEVEASLLEPEDWTAQWVTGGEAGDDRPQYFRHSFRISQPVERARLYATSAGVNLLHLNGDDVSANVLSPGWTPFGHRLRYETHDVTDQLVEGENVLAAVIADGWWRGSLTSDMTRCVYGDRLGVLAQLEITHADGRTETIGTGPHWRATDGPCVASDLYNGEIYDARRELRGWAAPGFDDSRWAKASPFEPDVGVLVARSGPPVRRTGELAVADVITTPAGRTVLDFGQNLVGRVRFTVEGERGTTVTLRHAEVMDDGELGTRPLRNAEATDRYTLRGGGPETWEPAFTFHGFRYAEVDGWPGEVDPRAFTAVVIHSDIERTGTFECAHDLLNQLHTNVVWSMRGNVVDVPTDCPQRDERLGWTGDLQVFAPTATFLYDVAGFVGDWLEDLRSNQGADGAVPIIVPSEPLNPDGTVGFVAAAWGDAATIVPWTLYERYGDVGLLARQFDSMRAWVDCVRAKTGESLVWPAERQLGDWLDPDAPPDKPWKAKTDAALVATAYFARSAEIVAAASAILGRQDVTEEYAELAAGVRAAFRNEFVSPSGRISSDSMTAYALAIEFGLYESDEQRSRASERLGQLAATAEHRISTGFVGTPLVLPALCTVGDSRTAYRLLTETSCPSWLYPVTMGATTIWERWDSMLPDGSINPGKMTSFNHYALGAVADWMHRTIGGIAPAAPGYRRTRIAPLPGRGVTSASCSLMTPYGLTTCRWELDGTHMTLDAEVPPNTSAQVILPGADREPMTVGSGTHRWEYPVAEGVVAQWADAPVGSTAV